MFHIGVATQHPPLPESGQLSEIGISFLKQCLIINSKQRPSAVELMSHPWILHFREALMSYEEAENANSPRTAEKAAAFDATSVARQAAKLHLKQVEAMLSPSPSTSPPSSSPATTP
jgi:mitogen-activated protein kinase kinase kinase